jgi:hypothetical protein
MNLSLIAQTVQNTVPSQVKPYFDILAIVGWITALAGALTTLLGLIAALASAAWGLIRLYETRTVQNWLKSRKGSK